MFQSLGMKEGMVFMQSFIEDSECCIYEMGYRLTGSIEHHIFEKLYGFNHLEEIINYAVGNVIDDKKVKKIKPKQGIAANITLLLNEGKIHRIEGIEEVMSQEGVLHIFLSYKEGDMIDKKIIGTLAQAGIRVILYADTKEQLIERMDKIKNMIKVLNSNNENMIIANYTYKSIIGNE